MLSDWAPYWIVAFREPGVRIITWWYVTESGFSSREVDARKFTMKKAADIHAVEAKAKSRGYLFQVRRGGENAAIANRMDRLHKQPASVQND